MKWNHRTFEHRNSALPKEAVYFSVHEVHYADDGKPAMFSARPASPRTKREAMWIARAFNKPAVGWLDDATYFKDENGFDDYREWGWL